MLKRKIFKIIQKLYSKANYYFNVPYYERIPIKNILSSGEAGIPSNQYARMINDPLRASQRILNSPHSQLLRDYHQNGVTIFEKGIFEQTAYYQNALIAMSYTGFYFEAKKPEQIINIATNFIAAAEGKRPKTHRQENGHNKPDDPIEVRAITNSNCYELVHGNHRLASAVVAGKEKVIVKVQKEKSTTPAQDMVRDVIFDVFWQRKQIELRQPIDLPEFETWPIVRMCTDRASYIDKFLADKKYNTSIDLNCSYGWFVKYFQDKNYHAKGINMDPFALRLAQKVYGIPETNLIRSEIVNWLQNCNEQFDVVTCFNFIHHIILGRSHINYEELLHLLDKITGSVLFIDIAQEHEALFRNTLLGWSTDYIQHVIRENTSFTDVYPLGCDNDNRGEFEQNFGRTLFACVRN